MTSERRARDTDIIFVGASELARRMRELDWARTPIGPVEGWPQSLRTAVSICLESRFPLLIWWGPRYVKLYNDAYSSILGNKHPAALGSPGREVWPEIWPTIGPMLDGVIHRGQATWSDDLLLLVVRRDFPEECYFTFTYSPIRDQSGGVGGVFCAVIETTGRVIGERRLATLRELATRTAEAKSVGDAALAVVQALAQNPADLPFALLYLLDDAHTVAHLASGARLEVPQPDTINLSSAAADDWAIDPWRVGRVCQTGRLEVVEIPSEHAWPASPLSPDVEARTVRHAIALPITRSGQTELAAVMVCGISPHLLLDDDYRGFLDLVAGQTGTALANARAAEEERRRIESLAELDRAKTLFFSNVSHEFRTPLTLALGPVTDALEDQDHPLAAEQRDRLEIVQRNHWRLLKLVNTLLEFARIEAGRSRPAFEPTDLAAYTAGLASVFRSAIERAGLRFSVDCPPQDQPVYVDRSMWEKIVLNLLSNALKFTFTGEVRVSLAKLDETVVLEVRDTGVGIPPSEMPHLFERFHRVAATRARTQEGSGIGLALVSELVRLHGGSISATSTVGEGTTFSVCLPIGAAHLQADGNQIAPSVASTALGAEPFVAEALRWLPDDMPAAVPPDTEMDSTNSTLADPAVAGLPATGPPPSPAGVRRARILVADDNADMRAYLRRLLAHEFVVDAVPDGEAALAALRAHRPDLILADVMMPILDGFGLLRQIRASPDTETIPFVLLSARAGEEARVEGLRAGADDYLIKPFTSRELLARISARIDLTRVRAESEREIRRLMTHEQAARNEAEAAQRQLEAAVQARDDVLALVSHDLKNPLAAIKGHAQLNLRRLSRTSGSESPGLCEGLLSIEASARRMEGLIDELLDQARLQSGQPLDLKRQPADLVAIARRVVAEQQKVTKHHHILVETARPTIVGHWDAARIERVVENLLSNAIKYSPAGGQVTLQLVQTGEGANVVARLAVRDSGIGIPSAELDRVFERFYRASNAAELARGTGLGLAGARQVIEQHGGRIWADSVLGQGSSFAFELPLGRSASDH
jgi:signal transduction histidine kinase